MRYKVSYFLTHDNYGFLTIVAKNATQAKAIARSQHLKDGEQITKVEALT